MKNFFIVLLLIIIACFVLLFVKPEHELSQKLFTYINVSVEKTGLVEKLDLTDCISYFDGCNNCAIVDGEIGACTRMHCDIMQEPRCLEYIRTGMDLSDCNSYFDGCNTCSVVDGKLHACTMMYCENPEEPRCLQLISEIETEEDLDEEVVCTLELKKCSDGSSVGRTGPNCEFAACPNEETKDEDIVLDNVEKLEETVEETVE